MTTRRTYIGRLNGNFVLRATLPGYDAVLDDANDSNKFAFNSAWTDMVKLLAIGIVTVTPIVVPPDGIVTYDDAHQRIPFPAPGYIPFCEVKYVVGNILYDDYNPSKDTSTVQLYGADIPIKSSYIDLLRNIGSNVTYLYAVYPIPVPSQ